MQDEIRTAQPVVDIAIPVYNEERDLETSVRTLHAYLAAHVAHAARITIVDNASTDATPAIGMRLARELDDVRCMRLDEKGRGRALRAAWLDSDAEIVAYMDVDLSTDLDALRPLLEPLIEGRADITIGSRLTAGAHVTRGLKRECISRGYNLLLRLVLHARYRDAQCGFKAVRTGVARELLPKVHDQGWFFDTELLTLAQRLGMRILEVPVTWIEDTDSRVHIASTAMTDLRGVVRMVRDARHRGPPRSRIPSVHPGTSHLRSRGRRHHEEIMQTPRRRLTVAERDRALRFRKKLTVSSGIAGTVAVVALAALSAQTHAGTTTATSTTSMTTTATSSAAASSTATPSPLATGSASSGSSSSASTVSGAS